MATAALEPNNTIDAGSVPGPVEEKQEGFDVELSAGQPFRYESAEAVKAAILSGVVPRTAQIHEVGGATGSHPVTVEAWAKSNPKLRSLYAPIWSFSLKGALVGFIVVGILKVLDTLVTLASVNPGAAFLWLLIGAAIFSPKFKVQLMAAALYLSFNMGASFMTLWGAWFGVAVFAAVFGISFGMFIGTIVGLLRARTVQTAPDAAPEGSRPITLGLVIPLAVFTTAAVAYFQVFVPAVMKMLEK